MKLEKFLPLLERIKNSTAREPKGSILQIVKLFEEVGELAAEVIKREGYTYKEFEKEEFYSEVSDVIIMIWAFFFKAMEEDKDLSFSRLLEVMSKKIDKWDTKLDKKTYWIQRKSND